jgi:hypothetical protein
LAGGFLLFGGICEKEVRGLRQRFDLHVHSHASPDAMSSLAAIIRAARRRGIQGVAITDHDIFHGQGGISCLSGMKIIWGQEVSTKEGELIGLFLNRTIPSGLSPEETIDAIRGQGGVTYLPHPYKKGGKSWTLETLERIGGGLDVVEVYNGRLLDQEANRAAVRLAEDLGVLQGAGSDAHTPWEVGRAFVEMAEFDSPATFLHGLRNAKIFGRPPSISARILLNRFSRKFWRYLLLTLEQHPFLKKLWLPF